MPSTHVDVSVVEVVGDPDAVVAELLGLDRVVRRPP